MQCSNALNIHPYAIKRCTAIVPPPACTCRAGASRSYRLVATEFWQLSWSKMKLAQRGVDSREVCMVLCTGVASLFPHNHVSLISGVCFFLGGRSASQKNYLRSRWPDLGDLLEAPLVSQVPYRMPALRRSETSVPLQLLFARGLLRFHISRDQNDTLYQRAATGRVSGSSSKWHLCALPMFCTRTVG